MNFLVDMPLSPELAAWLREEGHDAVHAAQVGLARASDLDILARARNEHRTVITADLDYPRLLSLARLSDPSLILFRDGNWNDSEVIARMRDILRTLQPADIADSIVTVDRNRVRKRRLPIERRSEP